MAGDMPADQPPWLTRRGMLGAGAAIPVTTGLSRLGVLSARAAAPLGVAATATAAVEPVAAPIAPRPGPAPVLEGLETLNANEMEALEAFCARLIPTDAHGPGASEARAAHYIDRALGGPMVNQRAAYAAGLSALDAYARSARGKLFAQLVPAEQDAVLHDMEANKAPGFTPGSAAFFALVRAHTIEGMFSDPYYGGNANFVGWDLVGYPGLRMMVGPEDQRFAKPKALRQSAYSVDVFGGGTA